MSKKRVHLDYDKFVMEQLRDTDLSLAYLKEALKDDDEKIFLLALKRVLEAQEENFSEFAKKANLNREHLYKIFSKKGNPRYTTLNSILHQIGFELTIQPYSKSN